MTGWWRSRWSGLVSLALLVASLLPALSPVTGAADPAVVVTENGPVRGEVEDGYRVFRGLPFAAPPVGELRWQAPQPVAPWTEIRPATESASPCVQPADFLIGDRTGSEDCLYLEVTTPDSATAANPKPVVVWLHGGAFIAGAGSLYDPHRMAMAGDVVVVTVNYRLGVFGFLSFPGLAGSGTFGLQDQQAALRWVYANIAAFGGDPDNVTLAGESAGGLSICAHLASPAAAGLFHKAIIQSGPCDLSWPANGLFPGFPAGAAFTPLAESTAAGAALGALYGCFGPTAGIACLRDVSAGDLGQNQLGYAFTPAYDTPLLPQAPATALAAPELTPVPVIIGATQAEMIAFFGAYFTTDPLSIADYRQVLGVAFGNAARAIAWTTALTDRVFACPTLESAGLLAAGAAVYAYEFADPAPPLPAGITGVPAGAYHASELSYLFDMIGAPAQLDHAQRQLAAAMIAYWTAFAHTGDTNQGDLPTWAPFDPAAPDPVVLSLRPGPGGIASVDYAAAHHCAFWATVMAAD